MSSKKIGEILKEAWQHSGMSQKEFAEKMSMSFRNLQYLFEKTDIHISQLAKASAVLKTDIIKIYLENEEELNELIYPNEFNEDRLIFQEIIDKYLPDKKPMKNEVSVQLNIKGDFILVSKYFPEIMNAVKKEVELYGLQLT